MTGIFRNTRVPSLCAIVLGLGSMLGAPGASAQNQSNRVEICHKDRTVSVSRRSIPGHQRHGDTVGPCPNPLETMRALTERLMLSCAINADPPPGTHDVTGATMSTDITADLAEVDLTLVSCPEALVVISEGGCKELNQFAAPEAQTYLFVCPSAVDDAVINPPDER